MNGAILTKTATTSTRPNGGRSMHYIRNQLFFFWSWYVKRGRWLCKYCCCYCKVPCAYTLCGRWALYRFPLLLLLLLLLLRVNPHGSALRSSNSKQLVSWCFEPSQPQRITSGLNTNFTLSPSYSFHESLYHKSCFLSLFIFRGHSTREPASGRVTYFILRAYTGTMC